jgi:hypothetical protein
MFETGPFRECPRCRQDAAFGILAVKDASVVKRCKSCRYSDCEPLPVPVKKVVYLDQFAVSSLYKIKSGKMPQQANSHTFWVEAEKQVSRAYLLQQVVFPESNVHDDETTVSAFAQDLRVAHEMLSGGTSFLRTEEVELEQAIEFAKAFIEGAPAPALSFAADVVLERDRNVWLPKLHVTTNMDMSFFAPGIRRSRDESGRLFDQLAVKWAAEKPKYNDILKSELGAYASSHIAALKNSMERVQRGLASGDMMEVMEGTQSPVMRHIEAVKSVFEGRGVPSEHLMTRIGDFWRWEGCEQIPSHRISAYLFAAIAAKMAAGQKRLPGRGALNDVRAISCYAPYVDALLIDNEFAGLLSEQRTRAGSAIAARVFSIKSGEAFIAYMRELADGASDEVREQAQELYGVK